MPDLDKLVMMSQIFGVSTDYLLKDTDEPDAALQEPSYEEITGEKAASDINAGTMEYHESPASGIHMTSARELSIDEVDNYQKVSFASAKKIARGVFLCILGAVLCIGAEMLILELLPLHNAEQFEDLSALPLLICVAAAIAHFVPADMQLSKVEHFQKERFVLPDMIEKRMKEESENFHGKFATAITVGVVLIIAGVIAVAVFESLTSITGNMIWEEYVSGMTLLLLVAVAVYLFIVNGMKKEFYHIILQEEEYATNRKKGTDAFGKHDEKNQSDELIGLVAAVYWCIVTAGYLGYSFLTEDWGRSWIVWPVAGCLFGAVAAFISIYGGMKKRN